MPEKVATPADKRNVDLSTIALTGLDRAQAAFEKSAANISRATVPTDSPAVDTVDLTAAVIGLMTARRDFDVNVKVSQVADEMERHALDILA